VAISSSAIPSARQALASHVSLVRVAALLASLAACGKSGSAEGFGSEDDASPGETPSGDDAAGTVVGFGSGANDGGVFAHTDASAANDSGFCDLGAAGSFATDQDLNLFGQIVYFEDGGSLPAGRYRATYADGCMKYDYIFNWQVQASAPDAGGGGFWFVGDTSDDRIVMPPGTTMSYPAFDDCVAANLAVPPEEFDFDGGKLGVWLNDNPYVDNVAGENGRNPKWQLTLLGACPPYLAPK
jgi:hypothetical protein